MFFLSVHSDSQIPSLHVQSLLFNPALSPAGLFRRFSLLDSRYSFSSSGIPRSSTTAVLLLGTEGSGLRAMKALVSSFLLFLAVVPSSATTEAKSTPLTCPYWTLFVGVLETSSSAVLSSLVVEENLSGLPVAGVCVCICEEPDLSRSETSSPDEYLNFFRGVVKGDKGSIDGPPSPDVVVRGDVLLDEDEDWG